jgi:hypothetical protein
MAKRKNSKANKKRVVYIIATIIIVAALIYGIVQLINSGTFGTGKASAESVAQLMDKAKQSRKSNDASKAETYLQDALKQVEQLPVTDENTNTKIDIESQIYAIQHSATYWDK